MARLTVDIATGAGADAARDLRHAVFVEEMGVDPACEADRFDADATHLILRDAARPAMGAIGALRLRDGVDYTAGEFDVARLRADGRKLAELGRMCLHRDYRGGAAAALMLTAALRQLDERGIGLVVGTGSFFGADPDHHMPALRALRDEALAPEGLRPRAIGPQAIRIEGPGNPADMRLVPALLKSYVRAGAWIGQGAWLDREFGTIDVCLVMDMARIRLPAALKAAS
ncbi:GNAT family N-acetyltransferase [Jannaschia aquimarina]|uniref:L-ornithine N(alpha)-acyltransferase n=1 Tax=Jannaschia aquimarina TaxID=935700 RepID=A0A0D1CSQ6_9RHOB|nr:GNAT family N-acetyltransferase [Jannaschia aquimarina]KIT17787.1 hypothetical protein jaqu_04460 [Jannaschia aquimarina]SNT14320.1 ornithine-acyl[acyl carrier protein] N-acyltransferase [Jannaschia aquimarina]